MTASVDPASATLAGALGAVLALAMGLIAGADPLVAVVAALGLVYVVAVLNRLLYGVVTLALLSYLTVLPASPMVSPAKIAGVLLAVSWLAVQLSQGGVQLHRRHRGLVVAAVLFVVWLALSLLWAGDRHATVVTLLLYVPELLLLPIVYSAVGSSDDMRAVCLALVAGTAVAAVAGIVGPPAPPHPGVVAPDRAEGTLGEANTLAAALLVGAALSVGFAAAARRLSGRLAFAAVAGLALVGIFLSLSRGGLAAVVIACLAGIAFAGRWRRRCALAGVAVLVAGVAYFGAVASLPARERVTEIGGGTGRLDLWTIASRMIADRPLTGVGAGNFQTSSVHYLFQPGVIQADQFVITTPKVAHNLYLQVAAENGLVGAALLGWLLLACVRPALAAARRFEQVGRTDSELIARSLVVALAGFLTASLFLSTNHSRLLWLLLALGPAALRAAEAEHLE